MSTSETDFRETLQEALSVAADEGAIDEIRTSSFDDVGLLTSNEGLVARLPDGSEFQVTIVKSK